jgi:3-hydroxyisobutyrate dehydrogenase-like beta-hydroxyacid dehydrogenase
MKQDSVVSSVMSKDNLGSGSRTAATKSAITQAIGLKPGPGKTPDPIQVRIGFIGLGRMGIAMATNLVRAGYMVAAYVRHPDRMNELAALGLEPTTNIADLFDRDIVITMLPDDGAVAHVVFGGSDRRGLSGLAAGLKPGAIHLSMSTISMAAAAEMAAEHANWKQGYVAAPVFGNPDAAKARELFIIAAGLAHDIDRCQPIFEMLGQRTFVVGSEPAAANPIKLGGNAMIAATLETIGEVVALVRKRGGDTKLFYEILTQTLFDSRVHRIYGGKIVKEKYEAGLALPLALKDVRLALSEADAAIVPMPLVGVVHDRMIAGIARGYEGLDWSVLGRVAADEAGLTQSDESCQS